MRRGQSWLLLMCLTVSLLFSVSNAMGAFVFLDWNFNSETPGAVADWQVIEDSTGIGRYGYARLNTGTMDIVASPLPGSSSNYALQFGTFGGNARVYQQFTVTPYPANQMQIMPSYLSTGVSARVLVKIDTPVSSSDAAEYLMNLYDQNGSVVFGLSYTFESYGGGSDESGFKAKVKTSDGAQTLMVSQSAIEAQLGYSIIGKAIVPLITWAPGELSLYIDGQLVGSQETTGTLMLSSASGSTLMVFLGNDLWLNTNRLNTYDDLRIWIGGLTEEESLADYRMVVPAVGAPTFTPVKYINGPTDVTISSATSGASIYYTDDGTDPISAGNLYTGPVAVDFGTTLKAIAYAPGYRDSEVVSVTYTKPTIMPVVGWSGIPASYISVARFQEMRDAGFTHQVSAYYSTTDTQNALDCAEQAGVKLYVNIIGDVGAFTSQFENHPALEGYYVDDEPVAAEFADLAAQINTIRAWDPSNVCYVNVNGQGSGMTAAEYQSYIDGYMSTVPVEVISFTSYPIRSIAGVTTVRNEFYENLEIISAKVEETNRPFWGFALATAHADYPIPTLAHLRFQVYSNLAYGAQGIQYFTYWTPNDYGSYDFHDGPIEDDGTRTAVYDLVTGMNQEIEDLSSVFIGAQVLSVGHTGTLPQGTTAYSPAAPISSLTTVGTGAVVSTLVNDDVNYLAVVNRDLDNTMTLNMTVDISRGVSAVAKDGTVTALSSGTVQYTVDPGDIVILKWDAVAVLPGDANSDGAVDVGDLGILAANYGTATGATWALGDFNGDGAVDVGDLGILAANYGSGGSGAADFDADYAKVFGSTADEVETIDEGWPCVSLGLPLIAGLALIGLMLVKLED